MARKFTVEIEVRFSDLDAYGHVNNAGFLTYLEIARVKSFDQNFVDFMKSGLYFVVARVSCEYKRPILLEDRVVVDFEIPKFGRVSFDIIYELHNGAGVTFAKAKTTMVSLDSKTRKTVPIPASVVAALS